MKDRRRHSVKIYLYEIQPHAGLNLGCHKRRLVVFTVQEKLKGKLRVWVGEINIPASVIVSHEGTIPFEHQLADSAAVDAELAAFVVLLHSVVKNAVVNLMKWQRKRCNDEEMIGTTRLAAVDTPVNTRSAGC